MKQKERFIATLFGIRLTVIPTVILGVLAIFGLTVLVAATRLSMHLADALLFGLLCTIVHFAGEVLHHIGHIIAARSTGHPMIGLRFGVYGLFAASVYPKNEPELPGTTHIRRAMGGPIFSTLVGLALFMLTFLPGVHGAEFLYPVLVFAVIEQVGLLGLGALLPLPFTDGGTILTWWGKN